MYIPYLVFIYHLEVHTINIIILILQMMKLRPRELPRDHS